MSSGISFFRYDALRYPIGDKKAIKYGDASSISIPITMGYKIKPSKNFIFTFEITANHSYSDNLDGSYPGDKQNLSSDNFSSLSRDWYVFRVFNNLFILKRDAIVPIKYEE